MIQHIGYESCYSQISFPVANSFRKWTDSVCYSLHGITVVIASLIHEPLAIMRATFDTIRSLFYPTSSWGVNPEILDSEKASKCATLLIHGNFSDDSNWIPLLDRVQGNKNIGPIYTVNLPSGSVTEADQQIVDAKLTEILRHYATHGKYDVNIHLVGFSRGVDVLNRCIEKGLPLRIRPVSVTGIGSSFTHFVIDWLSMWSIPSKEILAGKDALAPRISWPLPDRRIFIHDCGHVGLLQHQEVQNQLLRRIS